MRDRQQGWSPVFWCAALALLAPQAGWTQSTSTGSGQAASTSSGQAYPNKSIRLIVPFAAGGNTDIIARFYTPKMSELLGQQIIIDNRPGAGGVVGTEIGAKASPANSITLHSATARPAI